MANNYDVTTLETKIPSEHFKESHALALDLVGFRTVDEGASVYLYTPAETGTSEFNIDDYDGDSFDIAWALMLDETGLEPHANEPFVQQLRRCFEGRSSIGWDAVVQTVLADMPLEAVPHLDFQGAYWCDKERQSEFGGFAMRITRDSVLIHESAQEFFQRLDREQKWAHEAQAKPPQDRVEDVVDAVLGEGETSLGQALRQAFPEATSGDVAPGVDRMAVDGLTAMVRHWVDVNVSIAEDAPESPRP
ncbi:MAG: hypothetical protein ACREPQ_00605 [Rhodanobacter sp.]